MEWILVQEHFLVTILPLFIMKNASVLSYPYSIDARIYPTKHREIGVVYTLTRSLHVTPLHTNHCSLQIPR